MIVIYVAVNVKDGIVNQFEQLLQEVQEGAMQLTGCVKYEWFHDPYTAQRYVVYGEFGSHESFKAYLQSSIVQRIGSDLMPLLVAPPEFRHYDASVFEQN